MNIKTMNSITKSYIAYTRGETAHSLWAILKPLGWGGASIVRLRRALYDRGIFTSEEAPLPIISVGNLTTGGTNKTPFVEYIANYFCDAGIMPGIITRGYGGKTSAPVVMVDGNAPRSAVGDEPLLLSRHLPRVPIAVSRDRAADVQALLNYRSPGGENPYIFSSAEYIQKNSDAYIFSSAKYMQKNRTVDVVIADDAFQHRRLAREVDIVLLDPICPFGNGSTLPSGILRELPDSLSRAHIVVITKADQASPQQLESLVKKISKWVPSERIFYSRVGAPEWAEWTGKELRPRDEIHFDGGLVLFSAIGAPRSFYDTVAACGAPVLDQISFKDHHHYRLADLQQIEAKAQKLRAAALCCTEKDICNLPPQYVPSLPLLVPRISTQVDDAERFWHTVTEALRPHIVIASNGNGEDAIGARLACKIRQTFPAARIEAFPLVGRGEPYKDCGIPVDAPVLNSPTGGIIKYHLRDFVQELRAGLLRHIISQFRKWKKIRPACRTVLCVGDAYLLCHTILGQGKKAILIATAKTQLISGHWKLESAIYRRVCRRVWTRDEQTAAELRRRGVPANFDGNPIMDLRSGVPHKINLWDSGRKILILPGSRSRAYADIRLLLSALKIISASCEISAVLVVAHSLDLQRLIEGARGWTYDGSVLTCGPLRVKIYNGEVTDAAEGAELLLGLGGTANQVCAGMGIPVLSILEKGKLVQKKLLGEAELLVRPDPEQLAAAAISLLNDPARTSAMSQEGKRRLGPSGSLDAVIRFAARDLGWAKKCALYENLRALRL